MDRRRSLGSLIRLRPARDRTGGWWLAGGLLVLVLVLIVVVLELWEHPPGWLLGPRRLAVAGLHWMRGHWLTFAGLGVTVGFIGVVGVTVVVFWRQRRGEEQYARTDRAPRSAEAKTQQARLLREHCWVDEATGWLPRVSALADPVALGVRPATPIAELDVKSAPPTARVNLAARVPVYVPRDLDAGLDAALARGGLVLLRGAAIAGKSRTAYEAMRRLPGNRFVLIPAQRDSLRALRDAGLELQNTVVWLDNLERFLGPGGLDTGLLDWLVGDGTRQVVVLGTMRASEYSHRAPVSERDATAGERDLLRADHELLDQAVVLELAQHLSPAEQGRTAQRAWDPRIAAALERAGRYGLAEYMAAGPRLWQRWRSALAVDNPLPDRVGAALVAAAIDCRRAGLARPVPEQILRDLLPSYLKDEPDAGQLAPTVIADGLAWATTPVQATSALVTPDAGGYVVFDYLLDQVEFTPGTAPVPDEVWERLLVGPHPEDAFGVGVAAYQTGQRPIAERAFRVAADASDHDAESNLGVLLRQQGKLDEAEQWYRRAADAGHHPAEYNLGVLLEKLGRVEEAEQWYRRAADAGHHPAENNLGVLLEDLGPVEEAEQWYRRAADAGHHPAENNLGVLLRQQGKLDEAEQWYRRAADAGHHDAQYNLGVLLEDLGRVEEAEQWYRQAADAGMRDQVEWAPDAPSDRDLLRRRPLAQVIATHLRRLQAKEPGTSFLIHVDGPWGAGKSTIMRFLREELRQGWVTVEFDAWRAARIGPPWWALLAALRHSITRDLRTRARAWLRVAEAAARLRRVGAPFALALVLLLGLATGAFLLLQPRTLTFTTAGDIARTATAIVTALGTLWAGALVAGRLLLWDSARGARLFEQSNTNPMQDVAEHFGWLVAKARKPVILFIDDLDRCEGADVVALLDAIQTLVRDAPKRRPPRDAPLATTYIVVAADGAWLRASYEAAYERFTAPIAEPGRPLGYLFLDKLFQLRVPVPTIDAARHDGYLRSLLGTASGAAHDLAEEQDVLGKVRRSTTEGEVIEALRQARPTVRDAVAGAAAARLSAPRIIAATEHSLQRFVALLPPNPRSTKRFLNTYSILRAVRTLEANLVPSEPLALWTILETRWPSLADYLRNNPEAVELLRKPATAPDLETIPVEIRDLFTDPTIQRLADFEYGGPLTVDLIRACCGAAIVEATQPDPNQSQHPGELPDSTGGSGDRWRPADGGKVDGRGLR